MQKETWLYTFGLVFQIKCIEVKHIDEILVMLCKYNKYAITFFVFVKYR